MDGKDQLVTVQSGHSHIAIVAPICWESHMRGLNDRNRRYAFKHVYTRKVGGMI
jgi:hypothetical protein